MLANALGLTFDDLKLQNTLHLSVVPIKSGGFSRTIALMKKLKMPKASRKGKIFGSETSSPFLKEYVGPQVFNVYVQAEPPWLLQLEQALLEPKRPLYLGGSDDMVIVESVQQVSIRKGESDTIHSWLRLLDGIQPKDRRMIVGRMPLRFIAPVSVRSDFAREDGLVACPSAGSFLQLNSLVPCYINGERHLAFI
jgi:CRISPR-associated protein Cas5h